MCTVMGLLSELAEPGREPARPPRRPVPVCSVDGPRRARPGGSELCHRGDLLRRGPVPVCPVSRRIGQAAATRRAAAARRAGRAAAGTTGPRRRSPTTLSPASIIFRRSRVSGMFARQALGDERVRAHERHRHVDARPAHARGRCLSCAQSSFQLDDVRAAELESAPVRRVLELDRADEVCGDVVDPDRLQALLAGAGNRRDRREPRDLAERRQDPPVGAEHEARPKDHERQG